VPIEFKKVERAEMHVSTTAAQPLEICKAGFVAGDRLAVNQACGDLERAQRLEDERKRSVQSCPLRVKSRTPEAPRRAKSRKPSCLIS